MYISDQSLEMHLWSEWTRDLDIRNTSQLNTRQINALLKKRESYDKIHSKQDDAEGMEKKNRTDRLFT